MASLTESLAMVQPSDEDSRLAMETCQRLEAFLRAHPEAKCDKFQMRFCCHENTPALLIPGSVLPLVVEILTEISQGNAVTVGPVQATVTIERAADFLNVSANYVESLISQGEIPVRVVGKNRQILLTDLLGYKKQSNAKRRAALEEISALGQEIDEGF
jgi:excisionase family DNA binding protein